MEKAATLKSCRPVLKTLFARMGFCFFRFFFCLPCLFLCSLSSLSAFPVSFPDGTVIRDAEIEHVLWDFAEPVLKKADISPASVQIILIATPVVNAATSIGNVIFINTGLVTYCQNAQELTAVLAHEIGHMQKRHVIKHLGAMDNLPSLGWGALGIGALVAALIGDPSAFMIAMGAGDHVATRSLLHFSRSQESEADLASFELLRGLQWPIEGCVSLMERFHEEAGPSGDARLIYSQTHPLHKERLAMARSRLNLGATLPPHMERSFERVKEKIGAYAVPIFQMSQAARRFPHSVYSQIICLYRQGRLREALAQLPALQDTVPLCYVEEFRAQLLLELGELNPAAQAIQKALKAASRPHSTFSLLAAQIHLKQNTPQGLKKAQEALERILCEPFPDPQAWYFLSVVQGNTGQMDRVHLSLAEYAFITGDKKRAKDHVSLALKKLAKGTPAYRRAEDLMAQLKMEK